MPVSEQIFVEFALAVTAMKSRAALNFGLSMAERAAKAQRNAQNHELEARGYALFPFLTSLTGVNILEQTDPNEVGKHARSAIGDKWQGYASHGH